MTRWSGMNRTEDEFLSRMEEASMLPAQDPRRQAVRKAAEEQGPEILRRWELLADEADRLRAALAEVPVPPGLEARLRALPDQRAFPFWKRPAPNRRWIRAAAALLLTTGAATWAFAWWTGPGRKLDALAAVAAKVHQEAQSAPPTQSIASGDPAAVEHYLGARLPFPAIMLKAYRGARLEGGSVVQLDGAPAALTTWRKGPYRYSLMEFAPRSLGLPGQFPRREENMAGGVKEVFWTDAEKGCGWVLVMDAHAEDVFVY